jgi:hypothetical protein
MQCVKPTRLGRTYIDLDQRKNPTIHASRDQGNETYQINYGSPEDVSGTKQCEVCDKIIEVTWTSYLDSDVVQGYVSSICEATLANPAPRGYPLTIDAYIVEATKLNMIPVLKMCKSCRFNYLMQISKIDIDILDDIADIVREECDLMKENSMQHFRVITPGYHVAAAGMFKLHQTQLGLLKSNYHWKNGYIDYIKYKLLG